MKPKKSKSIFTGFLLLLSGSFNLRLGDIQSTKGSEAYVGVCRCFFCCCAGLLLGGHLPTPEAYTWQAFADTMDSIFVDGPTASLPDPTPPQAEVPAAAAAYPPTVESDVPLIFRQPTVDEVQEVRFLWEVEMFFMSL